MRHTYLFVITAAAIFGQGALSPVPKLQFFDNAGKPCVGCRLHTFGAGTTTPLATYTNVGLTVPQANPIILNARGEVASGLYLSPVSYKFTLRTSTGVDIWTQDQVFELGQILKSDLANTSDPAKGDALVGFKQPLTGSISNTVHDKLYRYIDVKDFGATGDGINDDSGAIQTALNRLVAADVPTCVIFTEGTYRINTGLTLTFTAPSTKQKCITGRGAVISSGLSAPAAMLKVEAQALTRYLSISNLMFYGGGTETEALLLEGHPTDDTRSIYMSDMDNIACENTNGHCLRTTGQVFEINLTRLKLSCLSTTLDCVSIQGNTSSSINFTDSVTRGGRNGLRVVSPISDVHIERNTFLVAYESGAVLEFVTGASVINNHIEANCIGAGSMAANCPGMRIVGGGSFIGNSGSTNTLINAYQKYIVQTFAAAGKTWTIIPGEFQGGVVKYGNLTAAASTNPGYHIINGLCGTAFDATFGIPVEYNGCGRDVIPNINLKQNFLNNFPTITPDLNEGHWWDFAPLAQNTTVSAATGQAPAQGDLLVMTFPQDPTGGWKVTWDAIYHAGTWQPDPEPFSLSSITFIFNETFWQPLSASPALNTVSTRVSWTPTAALANGATDGTTVALIGVAIPNWACMASFSTLGTGNYQISAYPSSNDNVRVTLTNHTGGPVTLGAGNLRILCSKF